MAFYKPMVPYSKNKSEITHRIQPGKPYPLGATWDGKGVNFALFSEHASKVELCLFDSVDSTTESSRIELPEYTDHVWHVYLPDLRPGQLYGYRVHGEYDPKHGHRFNENKLLLDPYAKLIARDPTWHDDLYGYTIQKKPSDSVDLKKDPKDSAPYAPLAQVVDDAFSWGSDQSPQTPWHKTIIYEGHVKGLSMLHPDVPKHLRGTYAGIASEPIINHLKNLGVTAIELLPIHHHLDEHFVVKKDLKNYWGYNTLGFFAPNTRYACKGGKTGGNNAIDEFKMMVRSLHDAGIEVILDVVYNHTAEGNHLGPTLSLKGIDNKSYYRLTPDDERYYMDYTGCGNTVDVRHPRTLQLIMDSLRYWVQVMHVDGFRFDLASALVRGGKDIRSMASFLDIIHQDPVLSRVKLIAEPWDLGSDGYLVGNFPVLWTEWNGKYRDTIRRFWKGDTGIIGETATRIAGSSDLYEKTGRQPHASINFITCHDGFTLNDLVSYNEKHNEANLEENRDGEGHNNSWNCGEEGDTDNPEVIKLRAQQRRNLMATLILSLGVPMISGGDELGRTQGGNNNAYCQDNEISWTHWDEVSENQNKTSSGQLTDDTDFLTFVQKLIALRKNHPVFQRRKFFMGDVKTSPNNPHQIKDIKWMNAKGVEMSDVDWKQHTKQWLGILLDGMAINEMDEDGHPIIDDTFFMILNAHHESQSFKLPSHSLGSHWELVLDTATHVFPEEERDWIPMSDDYISQSRSFTVFCLRKDAG